ncbi:MAG: nicotinate-nucleotide--dimethylbenzimidazole phosphoribosyltransferase [Lachnospiraceae bacterium]|nr:nicotinate-nucleotide--dimethylbenzimidazole phosphoribosyltransferase [Lachnospiraceae bacterium]
MLDEASMRKAKEKWDQIAKPAASLGRFESFVEKLAGIQGSADVRIDPRCVAVFCASNGIVEEGVSASPNEVTRIVSDNVERGRSSINAMAEIQHADVYRIDMGIDTPTRNFALAPAMTEAEAGRALQKGRETAVGLKEKGYRIAAQGEVGMGNTTTASAVICALLGLDPDRFVGRGAGLDTERLMHKRRVIAHAIESYSLKGADPMVILSCVGGYDIAGMAGFFLGAFEAGLPVIIDGVISLSAALLASFMKPESKEIMFPSHRSREAASVPALEHLGLRPVIDADMALGEGTGAVLMFGLLDTVLNVYRKTATYAELGLSC